MAIAYTDPTLLSRILVAGGAYDTSPENIFRYLETFHCVYTGFNASSDKSFSGTIFPVVAKMIVFGTEGTTTLSPINDFDISHDQYMKKKTFFTGLPKKSTNFFNIPYQVNQHPTLGQKQVGFLVILDYL